MATRGRPRVAGGKAAQQVYNDAVTRGTNAGLPFEQYISKIKEKCACCGSEPRQRPKGVKLKFNFVVIGKMTQVDTAPECMTVCGFCRRKIGTSNPWEYLVYLIECAKWLRKLLPEEV
jgi:hypothetical protein